MAIVFVIYFIQFSSICLFEHNNQNTSKNITDSRKSLVFLPKIFHLIHTASSTEHSYNVIFIYMRSKKRIIIGIHLRQSRTIVKGFESYKFGTFNKFLKDALFPELTNLLKLYCKIIIIQTQYKLTMHWSHNFAFDHWLKDTRCLITLITIHNRWTFKHWTIPQLWFSFSWC